ncbi:MAG TPA: amidohydrolase family protein [Spirochaetia bacterium]|nr:amidohydrolase family protein [Spirochaetales bacterium]HRY72150.1 amidohydrolase family protein [Spirochaetia bacterium]
MQSAGTILKGRFYSLAREGERFAALRVGPDGRIAETYAAGAPLPAGLPVRDLLAEGPREGRRPVAMVPAFIDSHVHFLPKAAMGALARPLARLEGGRLLPDCLEGVGALLKEEAEAKPRGPVIGYGLFAGALAERRLPSAAELDTWVPGRPVLVFSLDGHSSAYSSAALRLLKLESLAVEGRLSGEAHEFNMGRVMAYAMRGLGPAALARGIAGAVGEAAAAGLASLHCLEGFDDAKSDPGVAALALVAPRLPLRLKLWLQYTEPRKVERYARLLGNRRAGGCLAWEMDGSVSSRSAAFDRPYRDRGGSGSLYRSAEEAYALARPFFEAGYQLSAHAIGPRGIESILSAYERLLEGTGEDAGGRRLRIDHFEFPRPDQVGRAGRLRLVLPVQPGFAWLDERVLHSYPEALDEEAARSFCPLKSLKEAGAVLALSTDAPVQPFDPFVQVAGAVQHPNPAERLSVHEALRAYSWAGAYAAFEEGDRGTLEPGKYADFAVLDADPFGTPDDKLSEIRALGTWHEGRPLAAPPGGLAGFALAALGAGRRRL